MSISYRICTQISKDGDIWTDKTGYRSDIKETVSAKRGRNHRRQSVPGPYTHADKHPSKYSVSQTMGYLKGKSSLMIFDRYANLKYKYGNRHFWARGYYVDTVGRNKKQIAEYFRNQLASDQIAGQTGLKEFVTRLRAARTKRHKKDTLRGSLRKKCCRQTFRCPLRGFVRIRPL